MFLHHGGNYWTFWLSDVDDEYILIERQKDRDKVSDRKITPDTSDNDRDESGDRDQQAEAEFFLKITTLIRILYLAMQS